MRASVMKPPYAVSQPAVTDQYRIVGVGGQQRDRALVIVNDERMIVEALAVILHIVALKQECAVLAAPDERIPQLTLALVVARDSQRQL
jgi:hypothetical protein